MKTFKIKESIYLSNRPADPCGSEPRCDIGYEKIPDQSSIYNPPCNICKKVYSCTDCEGKTQISYVSQADADAICNSYYCATTYDCKGDGHLCKETSLGAAQTCADNYARSTKCEYTFYFPYALVQAHTDDDQEQAQFLSVIISCFIEIIIYL